MHLLIVNGICVIITETLIGFASNRPKFQNALLNIYRALLLSF